MDKELLELLEELWIALYGTEEEVREKHEVH